MLHTTYGCTAGSHQISITFHRQHYMYHSLNILQDYSFTENFISLFYQKMYMNQCTLIHSYRSVFKEHMTKNFSVHISLDYSFHTPFYSPCYFESRILSFLFQPTQDYCGINWFQQTSEVVTANFLNSNEVVCNCHSNYVNS